MSDFIETYTGKKLWLPGVTPEMIDLKDIAHALSLVCRFAGHINQFYSVAEHSINVAHLVPDHLKLQALLHDATEAYICDIPTPFKRQLPQYEAMECELHEAISQHFGIDPVLAPEVKKADRIMLMTERDFLKPNGCKWNDEYEATERVPNWEPSGDSAAEIRNDFIALYHYYKTLTLV